MVNRLHRHMLLSVIGSCAGAVGLFAFVLLAGRAIRDMLRFLAAGQMDWLTCGKLLALLLPFVVSYALPLGMLAGILLVLGRLSAQNEITAMRSAGLGIFRITSPVLLLAVAGTALSVAVNFHYAPLAMTRYRQELGAAVRASPLTFLVPRSFIHDFKGLTIYINERRGAEMRDVWIWQNDRERRVVRFIRAESGIFEYDEERMALRLRLSHAQVEFRNQRSPEDFSKPALSPTSETVSILLPLDEFFGKGSFRRKVTWMTFGELLAEKDRLEAPVPPGEDPRARSIEHLKVCMTMQEKFAMAFSVFSMALVGVPLGIQLRRKETSAGLGLALALSLSFYLLMIVIGWMDTNPALRGDLLMWAPNLAFQGLGAWLFWRVDRN